MQHGLERGAGERPTYRFLTTGRPEDFETTGRRFLGPELDRVTQFAGGTQVLAG